MKNVDFSTPRWRYWISKAKKEMKCPQCGGELESKHQPYVVQVRHAGELESIICGTNGGYFCGSCPSVVLDRDKFESIIMFSIGKNEFSYRVSGLVNMDAIPVEKRHVELGTDDNPVPLVEFKKPKQKNILRAHFSTHNKGKRKNKK